MLKTTLNNSQNWSDNPKTEILTPIKPPATNNRVQKTKPQIDSKKTPYQKLNQPKLLFLLSATKFHLQRHVPKVARALSKILSHVDDLNTIGDYLKILGKIHHQNGIKVCKNKGTGIWLLQYNVCSAKKYTKDSSNTLVYLVYFSSEKTLCFVLSCHQTFPWVYSQLFVKEVQTVYKCIYINSLVFHGLTSIRFYLSLKCLKTHSLILFIWGCVPGQLWWCHIKNSSSWAKLYMPSTLNT